MGKFAIFNEIAVYLGNDTIEIGYCNGTLIGNHGCGSIRCVGSDDLDLERLDARNQIFQAALLYVATVTGSNDQIRQDNT